MLLYFWLICFRFQISIYCVWPTNKGMGLFNAPLAVQGANSGPDDRSDNKADNGFDDGSFYNPGDVPGDEPVCKFVKGVD